MLSSHVARPIAAVPRGSRRTVPPSASSIPHHDADSAITLVTMLCKQQVDARTLLRVIRENHVSFTNHLVQLALLEYFAASARLQCASKNEAVVELIAGLQHAWSVADVSASHAAALRELLPVACAQLASCDLFDIAASLLCATPANVLSLGFLDDVAVGLLSRTAPCQWPVQRQVVMPPPRMPHPPSAQLIRLTAACILRCCDVGIFPSMDGLCLFGQAAVLHAPEEFVAVWAKLQALLPTLCAPRLSATASLIALPYLFCCHVLATETRLALAVLSQIQDVCTVEAAVAANPALDSRSSSLVIWSCLVASKPCPALAIDFFNATRLFEARSASSSLHATAIGALVVSLLQRGLVPDARRFVCHYMSIQRMLPSNPMLLPVAIENDAMLGTVLLHAVASSASVLTAELAELVHACGVSFVDPLVEYLLHSKTKPFSFTVRLFEAILHSGSLYCAASVDRIAMHCLQLRDTKALTLVRTSDAQKPSQTQNFVFSAFKLFQLVVTQVASCVQSATTLLETQTRMHCWVQQHLLASHRSIADLRDVVFAVHALHQCGARSSTPTRVLLLDESLRLHVKPLSVQLWHEIVAERADLISQDHACQLLELLCKQTPSQDAESVKQAADLLVRTVETVVKRLNIKLPPSLQTDVIACMERSESVLGVWWVRNALHRLGMHAPPASPLM